MSSFLFFSLFPAYFSSSLSNSTRLVFIICSFLPHFYPRFFYYYFVFLSTFSISFFPKVISRLRFFKLFSWYLLSSTLYDTICNRRNGARKIELRQSSNRERPAFLISYFSFLSFKMKSNLNSVDMFCYILYPILQFSNTHIVMKMADELSETMLAYRYWIAITMANVQATYIIYSHQFRILQRGPSMKTYTGMTHPQSICLPLVMSKLHLHRPFWHFVNQTPEKIFFRAVRF